MFKIFPSLLLLDIMNKLLLNQVTAYTKMLNNNEIRYFS